MGVSRNLQHHAFFVFCEEDKHIALAVIETLEDEYGLSCYYEDRDFLLGQRRIGLMEEAVQICRKTIAIVSKNFLESRLAALQADLAIFNGRKSSLIPLIMDDVNEASLPSCLQCITAIRVNLKDKCFYERLSRSIKDEPAVKIGGALEMQQSCITISPSSSDELELEGTSDELELEGTSDELELEVTIRLGGKQKVLISTLKKILKMFPGCCMKGVYADSDSTERVFHTPSTMEMCHHIVKPMRVIQELEKGSTEIHCASCKAVLKYSQVRLKAHFSNEQLLKVEALLNENYLSKHGDDYKKCPKCNTTAMRGFQNNLRVRCLICPKFEFCWQCLRPWPPFGPITSGEQCGHRDCKEKKTKYQRSVHV